jgi:integrase
MGGSVHSDEKVCACGGKFSMRVELEGFKYPKCSSCGESPKKLYVKKYLPKPDGSNGYCTIRYSKTGARLESILDAIFLLKQIESELLSGDFKPIDYATKLDRDFILIERYAPYYLAEYEKVMESGKISPSTLHNKKSIFRNHLIPAFKGKNLGEITLQDMNQFILDRSHIDRTAQYSIQELKVCMNFALERGHIARKPKFPPIRKSKKASSEEIISMDQQLRIIELLPAGPVKDCIKVQALFALRTGEARALKVQDFDFKKMELNINRHFSRGVLLTGRKSNKDGHKIPLVQSDLDIVGPMITGLGPSEFIFKGRSTDCISADILTKNWRKASKELGINSSLYMGTKHATLSDLKRKGMSEAMLLKFSGISNPEILNRYSQINHDDLREARMRNKSGTLKIV